MAKGYFSKWVEAESYVNIKDSDIVTFIWKNIVTRFSLPWIIVMNNGSHFISQKSKNFVPHGRLDFIILRQDIFKEMAKQK